MRLAQIRFSLINRLLLHTRFVSENKLCPTRPYLTFRNLSKNRCFLKSVKPVTVTCSRCTSFCFVPLAARLPRSLPSCSARLLRSIASSRLITVSRSALPSLRMANLNLLCQPLVCRLPCDAPCWHCSKPRLTPSVGVARAGVAQLWLHNSKSIVASPPLPIPPVAGCINSAGFGSGPSSSLKMMIRNGSRSWHEFAGSLSI